MFRNPYLALTEEFNRGARRVLLSSGQAVVFHRLAVMSKDGDWIIREDEAAIAHVLAVLESHGASYRFGAPLDPRWLAGGWSSHFEFRGEGLRIRTDFVSRPPRIDTEQLRSMWKDAERTGIDVIGLTPLAAIKLTNREKDYAVIGELARAMTDPADQLRFSRSAEDLLGLAARHPDLVRRLAAERPLLAGIGTDREALEEALDRERRSLMRINAARLARYQRAASAWSAIWPELQRQLAGLPLRQVHAAMVERASKLLPRAPEP